MTCKIVIIKITERRVTIVKILGDYTYLKGIKLTVLSYIMYGL